MRTLIKEIEIERDDEAHPCNKMADKLGHLWQQNILFLFHFL